MHDLMVLIVGGLGTVAIIAGTFAAVGVVVQWLLRRDEEAELRDRRRRAATAARLDADARRRYGLGGVDDQRD